ncbi:hypothetical protein [Szabonella alba]|uniref:Uncharacterized protein n=1 Tax=Szabonella alba TaxID=2804194 RepID=A0A8K0VBB9_9RHOB|nr:hypothetical protein [Szabonella alba]MBL4917083.1 hypothetical protein [Szabonella alba]
MAILKTDRNTVYAYEPLPEDSFVQTYLGTPEGRKLLTTCPVADYRAAVGWAVRMADRMAYPVELVPMTAGEFTAKHRDRLAQMHDQARGRLRQVAIASMLEVMRDCDDPDTRAEAYAVLQTLKVAP